MSKLLNWFENDELFFKECRQGQKWQEYVGRYLEKQGVEVDIAELSFRDNPNVADYSDDEAGRWAVARKKMETARKEYVNTKDITILPDRVVEVKSRNLRFTSPKDFPFETVIIDTVSGYNQKDPKPRLYVSVSRETGAMIATNGWASKNWRKERKFDRVRKIWEINYECPIEYWKPIDYYLPSIKKYQNEQ
jgi:hypothetical protein